MLIVREKYEGEIIRSISKMKRGDTYANITSYDAGWIITSRDRWVFLRC